MATVRKIHISSSVKKSNVGYVDLMLEDATHTALVGILAGEITTYSIEGSPIGKAVNDSPKELLKADICFSVYDPINMTRQTEHIYLKHLSTKSNVMKVGRELLPNIKINGKSANKFSVNMKAF